MVKVKVIKQRAPALPAYATPQSAGMDLRANIDNPVTLRPLERKLIPTGLFTWRCPRDTRRRYATRSGLAPEARTDRAQLSGNDRFRLQG